MDCVEPEFQRLGEEVPVQVDRHRASLHFGAGDFQVGPFIVLSAAAPQGSFRPSTRKPIV